MSWLAHLWFTYFWSSDKGNGPEALQQTVVYAAVAALFVPVVRHFIERHVQSLKAHISSEHAALREHVMAEHQKVHDRLDALMGEEPK